VDANRLRLRGEAPWLNVCLHRTHGAGHYGAGHECTVVPYRVDSRAQSAPLAVSSISRRASGPP